MRPGSAGQGQDMVTLAIDPWPLPTQRVGLDLGAMPDNLGHGRPEPAATSSQVAAVSSTTS